MAGAYEVFEDAVRSVASDYSELPDGIPAGSRAVWYEQVCATHRAAEIIAVQEYLHADPRTWLLCDISGLMYLPPVFRMLLARIKADCLAAGFDLDAASDGFSPLS